VKDRRGGGHFDDLSLGAVDGRRAERPGRRLRDEGEDLEAALQQPTRLERLVLDGIHDPELAKKLRSRTACKVTRVELEMALADRPLATMTPAAALAYASWILSSERGWSPAHGDQRMVREQLLIAAETGKGARALLPTIDPQMAKPVLRELRSATVSGQTAPALRLITQEAGEEVHRLLHHGAAGASLSAELAERLARHVSAEAARAARLHTDDDADLFAAAHQAHAVTVGDHVYFAHGQYAPGSEAGDDLLVHELTHVAQGQRGELSRAAAKGLASGTQLDPAEAEAELRAKLAVIDLHAPAAAARPPAAPAGQPASAGERTARLAAQQQRLSAAKADPIPDTPSKRPPTMSPLAAVAHAAPEMSAPARPGARGAGGAGGAGDGAYAEALEAPPSKQATEVWGQVSAKATAEARAEQAAFDAGLAPLPVKLDGGEEKGAKGSGGAAAQPKGQAPAGQVPPSARPAKATPPPRRVIVAPTAMRALRALPDKGRLQTEGKKTMAALPTSSPAIKTDPGPAPLTDLAGQADPTRTTGEQQAAFSDGAKALEVEKKKVLTGKGAAQVQPKQLDQKLEVPKAQAPGPMPELPKVEGMDKLKKWSLPAEVQVSFDGVARPKMDASLAQARAKMSEAEGQRDADRDKAVTGAHDKVKKAHADADGKQQAKVAESRTKIANQQADTLSKQEAEVKKLDKQSGDRKSATLAKVDDRVKKDQAKVDADYHEAQRKAEAEKKKGEQDAERKKREAQEKAEREPSWWERLAEAVCDAIQAVVDEIGKVLEAVGQAIGGILDAIKNAACALIDAARDFVCAALTEFGDWLKSAVTALLGSVFPELAAALNAFIDDAIHAAKAAVNAIADGLKSAVTALCDGLKAAVNAALAAFKAAVQAAAALAKALVTGDWAAVGKMVLEGILRLLGIDPEAFYALVGKAEDAIAKILDDPGAFVGHLVDAVKLGFQQFGANFLNHLKDGVVQWLFGTFAEAGIRIPAQFDIAGVFDLTCQVLGLTWPRLRGKVVKIIGEQNTERLEAVAGYLEALVTGGFAGLWEKVQQDLGSLWEMVIGGAKQWLMEKLVQQAILKLATMWNPVGAIVQLIQTAWNVYCWVKENAQRIFGLVQAVVDSISNIANGNIAGAANYIENSLAKLVPIAISLFANLLGLGGIADKIKDIITKIQAKVDQAIDKLIERVMGMFGGKGGKGDGKDDKKDGTKEVGETINFEAAKHSHRLWIAVEGNNSTVMVASTPMPVAQQLTQMRSRVTSLPADKKSMAESLLSQAEEALQQTDTQADQAVRSDDAAKKEDVKPKERQLADAMKGLFEIFEAQDGPLYEKSLQMHGHGHTLYVDVKGGKLVADLASRRQLLLSLVTSARRAEEKGGKRGPLLSQLGQIEEKLKELIEFERAGSYSTMPLDAIKAWTETIANVLVGIGAEYKIEDLEQLGHPSKYVEGTQLKEAYRSIVRKTFYGSGYWVDTEQWKADRLKTLINPGDPTQFKDEIEGTWEPLIIRGKLNDNVTIDHLHKVADHWNTESGNNMNQSGRKAFYNDTADLRLTAWKNNSSDGAKAAAEGLRYLPDVGPKFRGPDDED
jgi:Domain of unknown function (DUF4157)